MNPRNFPISHMFLVFFWTGLFADIMKLCGTAYLCLGISDVNWSSYIQYPLLSQPLKLARLHRCYSSGRLTICYCSKLVVSVLEALAKTGLWMFPRVDPLFSNHWVHSLWNEQNFLSLFQLLNVSSNLLLFLKST